MEKDVIVAITGLGMDEDEKAIETTTSGVYYQKDGKEHIIYTEYMDPDHQEGATKSRITLEKGRVLLHRTGDVVGQMVFEKGHDHVVFYETPFGTMEISMLTHGIDITREVEKLEIVLRYELSVNDQPRGLNTVTIRVFSRERNVEE